MDGKSDYDCFCDMNLMAVPREPQDARPQPIIAGLSKLYRYAGRSDVTVAMHSVRVAQIALALAIDTEYVDHAFTGGLIHDAHEAWTGDTPDPVKIYIGAHRFFELETRLDRVIYPAYGLDPDLLDDQGFRDIILAADREAAMEETEAGYAMAPGQDFGELLWKRFVF